MDPPYQRRGRLWSPSDKAYLIDSIINGFDVPKLYLADFQMGESQLNLHKLPYAIIDGKQRLEAIFDFFDGRLVLNHDFKWRADPSLNLGGLSLKDLKKSYPSVAEAFETETVDIMSVVTNDEADINELFVRLNRSKPLTGAEIRNAMAGPVPDVIRNVARHAFFYDNIRFSVKRAGDFNAAAKIVMFEYENRLTSTKKKDLDAFSNLGKLDQQRLELAGRRALDVLDSMQEVFLPSDELLNSAGTLPVYYWLVRQSNVEAHSILREFLVFFERARNHERKQQISGVSNSAHPVYARYDAFNRSTNDVGSYNGRFEVLKTEFCKWAQSAFPNLRIMIHN
ncbi:DUF262 domain-containing protein [Rhodopseudomonas sp.]|uniref:DUF262 domain-containing protein n=1 Tax=Rhodopseudomonas sp. TaxID=1078 RepID=UPI003B3B2B31